MNFLKLLNKRRMLKKYQRDQFYPINVSLWKTYCFPQLFFGDCFVFAFVFVFRAAVSAYGHSQARARIGATAASL